MNQKSIAFPKPALTARSAESWVGGTAQKTPSTASMSRLTLDLPTDLHRRLKVRCAERGERMAEAVRMILEREFPA